MIRPYISVIAPAHNEAENIKRFVERAAEALQRHLLLGEILIIDDGSTDRTWETLESIQARFPLLRVIRNPKRRGITYSLRRGFKEAAGAIFMFFPTDLESDPVEDMPKLLEPIKAGFDIAAGWRANKTDNRIKIISSKIFNWLVRILFHIDVHDLGWVKAIKREVIDDIEPLRADWHRFLLVFAADRGYTIKEVPLNFYPRMAGESKFGKTGFGRIIGAFIDLLSVKFLLQFSKKPMRVFGTTGVVCFLLGFAGGAYLTYIKFAAGSIGNRVPFLFLVVLLITMGIQLFAFGFLAEMIASVKDRIK